MNLVVTAPFVMLDFLKVKQAPYLIHHKLYRVGLN